MRLLVIGFDTGLLDPASAAAAAQQRAYYEGFDVKILVLSRGGAQDVALSPRIQAIRPGGGSLPIVLARSARRLLGMARRSKFDVVTVQDPFVAGVLGLAAARLSGAKLQVQEHGDFFSGEWAKESWTHRALSVVGKFILRRADGVRAVSERAKRHLRSIGVPEERITVLPVAQDLSGLLLRPLVSMKSPVRLIAPCRFVHQKGLDILLDAMVRLRDSGTSFHLKIVGRGPLQSWLEKQVVVLKLSEWVSLHAWMSPDALWSDADIFLMTSRYEGWGRTIVEAMAAGVSVVTTDVGCVGSVLRPGVDGVVVPVGDAKALAQGIIELVQHPKRREEMRRSAREEAMKLPGASVQAGRIQDALKQVSMSVPAHEPWGRIYLVALGVRLALLGLILWRFGQDGLVFPDSQQYLGLAQSLVAGKGFVYQGVDFSYRTIGYPLFLAGWMWLKSPLWLISVFQIAVSAVVPVFVLHLGKTMGMSPRVRRIAAWMCVFEPHLVFFSIPLLIEWFVVPFTLALFGAILAAFRTKKWHVVLFAAFLQGFGLLVKPLYQAIFPLVVFGVLLRKDLRFSMKAWLKLGAACLFVLAIIFPWIFRSKMTFGTWSLSSQGSINAAFYLGTSIVAVDEKLPYGEAEVRTHELYTRAYGTIPAGQSLDASYVAFALNIIRQHPVVLVKLLATNSLSFWTAHTYAYIPHYYHLIPPTDYSVLPPTHYVLQGRFADFAAAFWQIFSQPLYSIGVVGRVIWGIVFVLMLAGMVFGWKRLPRDGVLAFALLALYVTATLWVNGLGVDGRLRLSLMPFQWLFAVYAIHVWRSKHRTQHTAKTLRLMVITQRVDTRDSNLAFHVRWIESLAKITASVTVIAQSVGEYALPSNVQVISLGKEEGISKLGQFVRFYRTLWRELPHVDSVLVLMVPLYVLLTAPFAWVRRKSIYLWYAHKHVPAVLRVAVLFVRNVFSASPESFRLRTSKLRVVGHAIDAGFFSPDVFPARSPNTLVTVGRVTPVKRLEVLIEAVHMLKQRGVETILEIVGSPLLEADRIYAQQLGQKVAYLGLTESVAFRGSLKESAVRDAYRSATVFVNASATGSLDKAVLEAMACGCPVVTSNEAFADLPVGEFVPVETAGAFAEAIASQLQHPTPSEVLRARVIGRHELSHTMATIVDGMISSS